MSAARLCPWTLGDELNNYPRYSRGRYDNAIADGVYKGKTLRNLSWVARRYEPSRRRNDLSFSHHMLVAQLTPTDQDHWLDRAAAEGLSCSELRDALKEGRK